MEFITILGIVIILFLFLNNQGGNRFLSSYSSDWLILVSQKISTVEVKNGRYIEFIPILGWMYNPKSHKYGNLIPVTPPIYRVKDKIDNKDGKLEFMSYWIRDGREYVISTEWTSGNDFWSNLSEWVENGEEIITTWTTVPDSIRTKFFNILNKNP